jgi:glutathionyl-hydroquinone reductase
MANIMTREMKDGRFVRQPNRFTDRIGTQEFPAEAGRYQLYASLACPWAHRSLIVRALLGLEDTIGVTIVDPIRDERGWRFTLSPDDRDPVTGVRFLAELYTATDPSYEGRHTVPCVWDTETRRLVTNDYPEITLMLESAFAEFRRPDAPDLYPEELRGEIDALNDEVFHTVNNGVYKAGMATTQEAYEEPFDALFATLDRLEARLEGHDFLVGDRLTEADVRLYPTLARFDAVYYSHFKCNLRRIVDYPNLWAYARRLYAIPAFGQTTDFDHIKRHYYITHPHLNPSGVVPKGPAVSWT